METPIYDYRCLRPAFVCNSTTSTDWWRTVVKVEKDEANLVKVEYHHAGYLTCSYFHAKKRGFHVPWLDALGTCLNLWLIWLICSIYQHHPTSIIYIHVPRATFLPYGSYGGLGEFFSFGHRRPESVPKHVELNGPPAKRHWRKLSSEMLQNGIILQSDWMTNDIHLPAPVM